MAFNPRLMIHSPTVQGLPSTFPRPKKRLSHTVKAVPSNASSGNFQRIAKRTPLRRKHVR